MFKEAFTRMFADKKQKNQYKKVKSYEDTLKEQKTECENHDDCTSCHLQEKCLLRWPANAKAAFLAGQNSVSIEEVLDA